MFFGGTTPVLIRETSPEIAVNLKLTALHRTPPAKIFAPDLIESDGPIVPPVITGTASAPDRLTTTVPREYVHRAATSEVLLTGWTRMSPDTFRTDAQWPRAHCLFTPVSRRWQDPLLIAESIRQAGLLLAHAELGVPLDHHFALRTMTFDAVAAALAIDNRPTDVEIEVSCHDRKLRGDCLSNVRYEFVLNRDGAALGTGQITTTILPPAVYRALRRGRSTVSGTGGAELVAPEAPAVVGRRHPADVVLGPEVGGVRQLRVDPTHPAFFDHVVDHVPGMVLLEASRQAVTAHVARPGVLLLAVATEFTRYVEFDDPCWIRVHPQGTDATGFVVTAHQAGREAFRCTIRAELLDLA